MERAELVEHLARKSRLREAIDRLGARAPSSLYQPHEYGQVQFHRSPAMTRALFPGNGFGKTRALAEEVNAWCTHSCRWQKTPRWPIQAIWFAPDSKQFDKLRAQIEGETIGEQAYWKPSEECYVYPDGSKWYMWSGDRDWRATQGTNPDLIVFDEQPKRRKLWQEAQQRRRGKKKTRFLVGATATEGITFMKEEIYDPWLEFHEALGLTEEEAMAAQRLNRIWCWPQGGIDDNPGADEEDRQHYRDVKWTSEKERKVRLRGGFEDWTGDPIFAPDAIEAMREALAGLDELYGKPRRGMLQAVSGTNAA